LFRKFSHLELGGDVPDATPIGRFRQKLVEHGLQKVLAGEGIWKPPTAAQFIPASMKTGHSPPNGHTRQCS
jgi:hypothetical protein